MVKKIQPERNEIGDVDFGKFDYENFRQSRYTYVFNYYDIGKRHHFPYFELFSLSQERLEKATEDDRYFEVELYKSPDKPPYDFHIRNASMQLGMLIEFFKEVFHETSFEQGHAPSHKFFKIILPKETYNEIINVINEFELLPIRDLLFEVIAIAQKIYVSEIASWEKPERQKLISSAENETKKAIKILEKLDDTAYNRGDLKAKPSELLRINFVFNDGTVKLEHPWLTGEFVDLFKNHYDDLHFKDWRMDLARFPLIFDEDKENQKFKYKLAISLYNLFTKTGFFKIDKKKPTPNRLMLCIAKLLEFCLIKVAEPGELDSIKEKQIRNWIGRNKIRSSLTHAIVSFDRERLLKFFEPDFLDLGEELKRVDALNIGFLVAKRFGLERLEGDFSHIAQCLQQVNFFIGHQVTGQGTSSDRLPEEFKRFRKILNDVKTGKKIASIKFRMEDDKTEHEFSQQLPLYEFEQAISYYMEDQRVEIDTDVVQTSVKKTSNGFIVEKSDRFSLPEERFMVRFVKSFYNYLLVESPPTEFESLVSLRYYDIIGLILLKSGFFYTLAIDEKFVVSKVRQWHQLSIES